MRTFWLLTLLPLLTPSARAEDVPTVDITMADNRQGQVEIRMRLDEDFDGVVAALTFTLRWPASAGLAVDTAVRCYPFQDAVPMSATAVQTSAGYMYRTFNGFSITAMWEVGLLMAANHEYAICTADILVPGTQVELVNDTWTDANNRSFFCSLGGYEATGVIFPSPEPDVAILAEDQGTGNLDLNLTPEADYFGWVTSIDFTLRWPASSGVSFGSLDQDQLVASYLPLNKVGSEVNAGGFLYQRFHGTGTMSIANAGAAWLGDQPVVLASLPISGSTTQFQVVNDSWTGNNDGDYLIELNGVDHSAPLPGSTTSLNPATDRALSAVARPVANGFDLLIDLPATPAATRISLHNAAGQLLWNTARENVHGRMNILAATGDAPDGLYILSIQHGERSLTKRLVR